MEKVGSVEVRVKGEGRETRRMRRSTGKSLRSELEQVGEDRDRVGRGRGRDEDREGWKNSGVVKARGERGIEGRRMRR